MDIDLNMVLRSPGDTSRVACPFGVKTIVSNANVTEAAPTDSELDSAFGATPAELGDGFVGIVADNAGSTASILCWTSGGAWFHALGTKST